MVEALGTRQRPQDPDRGGKARPALARGQRIDDRRRHQRLRREVERRDGQRAAELEQDLQRLRVVPGVEFRGGGDVALAEGAAHQHDLRHAVGECGFRREGQSEVGHRAEPDYRHTAGGGGAQRVADRIRRDAGRQRRARRQHDAAEAIGAMDRRRLPEFAQQRAGAARHDGHGAARQAKNGARIGGGAIQPGIAAGHRHQPQIDLGHRERQPQRDRVIGAGIAIDDDGFRHRGGSGYSGAARHETPRPPAMTRAGRVWQGSAPPPAGRSSTPDDIFDPAPPCPLEESAWNRAGCCNPFPKTGKSVRKPR
jgi:hypothetical protein